MPCALQDVCRVRIDESYGHQRYFEDCSISCVWSLQCFSPLCFRLCALVDCNSTSNRHLKENVGKAPVVGVHLEEKLDGILVELERDGLQQRHEVREHLLIPEIVPACIACCFELVLN